ncbi:uncharacterized protein AMSG_03348 [Thecamonas trahens ATCC 50062]|uniref:Uncharacterized protein n=1 Tax=Thecamonas trahens ATCC 50062 TaxID=461836 RepID=A0A0L0D3L2_THETB|nr:hypothetical protein AMSG_03348 [Thecamonas trahens ATCC 50062]KNC46917.1 hypothetical protein AMSG_03348 [Thecamonas trahens ATCC 50062]|eukprot:XP_013760190.1 hypothetical protein AMSG_03348 [Thecamonas trahens ATCC 50062]
MNVKTFPALALVLVLAVGMVTATGAAGGGRGTVDVAGHMAELGRSGQAQVTPSPTACPVPPGPGGTPCGWYIECLGNGTTQPCVFIEKVMYGKCLAYLHLEPKLTPVGQAWSRTVRPCLEVTLAKKVLIPANGSLVPCDTTIDAFFNDHIGCYVDPVNATSFCDLPNHDKALVLEEAMSIVLSKYAYDSIEAALRLLKACADHPSRNELVFVITATDPPATVAALHAAPASTLASLLPSSN